MPCRIGPRQCRYLHIVSILVFSKFCKIFLMLNGFLSIGLHLFRYWRPHWKNHFQFRVAHRISVGISDQICAEFPNPFSIKIRLKWSEKSDIRWAVPSESVFDMHRHLEINFWSRQLEPWWPPSWRWWIIIDDDNYYDVDYEVRDALPDQYCNVLHCSKSLWPPPPPFWTFCLAYN